MERIDPEVLIRESRGTVPLLTINRPEALNALNGRLLTAIGHAVEQLAAEGAGAIVLTGAGDRSFSAGADLNELRGLDAVGARQLLELGDSVMRSVEASPVPVIAAVNGWALGGGLELALSSTFMLASHGARVGLPEARLGLMPGYGGIVRLRRAIGPQNARRLALTGEAIDATRAYELGLLSEPPLAPNDLVPRALELAQTIAAPGGDAVGLILEASRSGDAPGTLAHELALAAIAIGSDRGQQGIETFLEERRARARESA